MLETQVMLKEFAARGDPACVQVDVVEAARGGAAARLLLRSIAQGTSQFRGSLPALDLPEDLVEMTIGRTKAVGGTVTAIPIDPAHPLAGSRQSGRHICEVLGALGAPGDMTEAGTRRLGDLDAVVEKLAPAAQVDGLPLARRNLKAQLLFKERDRLAGSRAEDFDMSELR